MRLVTITPVVAEGWRGRSQVRDRVRRVVALVPRPVAAAEAAGVDLADLERIGASFPSVRVRRT